MSKLSPSREAIVITGAGAVCTIGNSVREIWNRLITGKPGSPTGGLSISAAPTGSIPDVKTDIHPQLAKSMGKHLSLLLKSAEEALEGSGLKSGVLAPEDIGFFAGMGMVDYHIDDLLPAVLKSLGPEGNLDYEKFFSRGHQEIYPLWPLGMLNNVAFCQAAIHFGIRGENCVFSPHADSGILAVAEGAEVLREKKAKAVLAGGISEEISPSSLARAGLAGLIDSSPCLKTDSGCTDSTGDSRSFFLGECGAMLVMEPLELAESRGARPLAWITGFGFSCDRGDQNIFPSPRAVSAAMKDALSQARMNPGNIDLIMVGSPESRRSNELEAIRMIWGDEENRPVLLSSGRLVGEVFAAGPILNAIIGAKIFESSTVPQSLAFSSPGFDGWTDPARLRKKEANPGRILVNAMSYEGQCATMAMEVL
jgi:3-oxoacyl-[acyl-carrier-protein] synthase II